ncbi:T9SS type A sorting domain-containing protein [Aquimarina spinulae]|uniref:T9SS type A sorting domain-containing protein n=1 Tax=Aquimarina spinulae TaxID=1192023 RepID=UPI000D54C342|nr:T9SS type A sorting domain-containing protein [Aquimarina spinulae]
MKLLKTLILAIVCSNALLAQQVYEDFENNTAKLAWEAVNGTYTLENDPANNLEKVGVLTAPANSIENFPTLSATLPNGFNMMKNKVIRIKIYTSEIFDIRIDLHEVSGSIWFSEVKPITKTNEWVEYQFMMPDMSTINKISVVLRTINPVKIYFDDIIGAPEMILADFENHGKTWTGTNGTFSVKENPNKSNENQSDSTGLFIKNRNQPYAFVSLDLPKYYSYDKELQIKILQKIPAGLNDKEKKEATFTRFTVKLENTRTGASIERRGVITSNDNWVQYAFDLSNIENINSYTYDKLLIFFAHNNNKNANSFYFDDVQFTSERVYPVDNSRTLPQLMKNSYEVFKLLRTEKGVYRDSKRLFDNNDYHPGSTAATGMGLVTLCIANEKKWETTADQVIKTLETVTGHTPGFTLEVNATGFARHYFNLETGQNEWNQEYSSIDTAILMAGAFFAKEYFLDISAPNRATTTQKSRIQTLVNELWSSIKWDEAIGDISKGTIYRDFYGNGKGKPDKVSTPFNEYIIVADMINKSGAANGTTLWNRFFKNPDNIIPTATYTYTNAQGHPESNVTITDNHHGNFLSSFLVQFSYYLTNGFATNTAYQKYFKNAQKADKNWWKYVSEHDNPISKESFEWGIGAGDANAKNGYHADKINDNWTKIVSPHIIAGFLPVDENKEVENDLLNLYKSGRGVYKLPNAAKDEILWRYSKEDVNWRPQAIQGVDFSTMLFGLYYLENPTFFTKYNNYKPVTHNFSGFTCEHYPVWNATRTYAKEVIVYYNNMIYISLKDDLINKTPTSHPSSWKELGNCTLRPIPTSRSIPAPTCNYMEYGKKTSGNYRRGTIVKVKENKIWKLYQAKWDISAATTSPYNIPGGGAWESLGDCSTYKSAKKSNSSFTVSPNPASNIISIKGNTGITSVEIYSIQGRKVLTSDSKTIDISGLINGLYILKLHTKDSVVETFKIMKE